MAETESAPISRKRSWYMIALLSLSFGSAELSHFLVGTTTRSIAQELHYGDQSCLVRANVSAGMAANASCSAYENQTA